MNRPWISCNLAISADGKISSPGHRPADWTSERDSHRLRELRLPADALLVGRGTAETDRMTLTVEGDGPQPLRCIVSRHGGLSAEHPLFSAAGGDIHLLATEGHRGSADERINVHEGSLEEFLKTLHRDHGVRHIHCEGGGRLVRTLAELDAIDEIHLTLAGHSLLGGQVSPTLTGEPGQFLPAAREFSLQHFEPGAETGECFLTYRRNQ